MTRGIHTLADLRERCHVDAETGCWHWQGYTDAKGPRVSFRGPDGTWQTTQGRRAGLILSGRNMAGKVAYARVHCQCADCIVPQHSAAGSRGAWTQVMVKRGILAPSPARQRAFTALQVSRRVMTMATAEAMRAEVGLSQRQIAEKYGVGRGVVSSVLAGLTYRRAALPAASVWTWRPAASNDERRAA